MVGVQRALPMELNNTEALLLLQRLLGQILFYPPNVAGWSGGKSWIDSTTLVTRMRLPQMLQSSEEPGLQPKADDDQMMGKEAEKKSSTGKGKLLQADINWTAYVKEFEKVSRTDLLTSISHTLLQKTPKTNPQFLSNYIDSSSRENFIQTATLQIMSLPEYQVC